MCIRDSDGDEEVDDEGVDDEGEVDEGVDDEGDGDEGVDDDGVDDEDEVDEGVDDEEVMRAWCTTKRTGEGRAGYTILIFSSFCSSPKWKLGLSARRLPCTAGRPDCRKLPRHRHRSLHRPAAYLVLSR